MARNAKGNILEKTRNFDRAIREYKAAQKMVEVHLGTQHQFYAMMSSAMGGAKLKMKTMAGNASVKEHIRNKVDSTVNPAPQDLKKKKLATKAKQYSTNKERDIQSMIKNEVEYGKAHARASEGLYLAKCDTWTK